MIEPGGVMRLFDPSNRRITAAQARRYALFEILHTIADFLAAFLFIVIGGLNEIWTSWRLIPQAVAGAIIATAAEFAVGCVVNLWLGWGIWDYSDMPGNLMGQICPQFALLWVALSALAIVLDDVIRWRFFGEERPHYTL